MATCSYCGKDVAFDASFCPQCGKQNPSRPKADGVSLFPTSPLGLIVLFFGCLIAPVLASLIQILCNVKDEDLPKLKSFLWVVCVISWLIVIGASVKEKMAQS